MAQTSDTTDYYGYLFQADKKPTKILDCLLRGIANYIIESVGDKEDKSLTPAKLAAFYKAVGGNYDSLFLSVPHPSISWIYASMGCQHTLQPASDVFIPPSVPALTLQGFVRWESIEILLGPDEHVPFIQSAVRNFGIKNPDTGESFPVDLPATAFPAEADAEIEKWHQECADKLRKKATPDEDVVVDVEEDSPNLPPRPRHHAGLFTHVRAVPGLGRFAQDYFEPKSRGGASRPIPFTHVSSTGHGVEAVAPAVTATRPVRPRISRSPTHRARQFLAPEDTLDPRLVSPRRRSYPENISSPDIPVSSFPPRDGHTHTDERGRLGLAPTHARRHSHSHSHTRQEPEHEHNRPYTPPRPHHHHNTHRYSVSSDASSENDSPTTPSPTTIRARVANDERYSSPRRGGPHAHLHSRSHSHSDNSSSNNNREHKPYFAAPPTTATNSMPPPRLPTEARSRHRDRDRSRDRSRDRTTKESKRRSTPLPITIPVPVDPSGKLSAPFLQSQGRRTRDSDRDRDHDSGSKSRRVSRHRGDNTSRSTSRSRKRLSSGGNSNNVRWKDLFDVGSSELRRAVKGDKDRNRRSGSEEDLGGGGSAMGSRRHSPARDRERERHRESGRSRDRDRDIVDPPLTPARVNFRRGYDQDREREGDRDRDRGHGSRSRNERSNVEDRRDKDKEKDKDRKYRDRDRERERDRDRDRDRGRGDRERDRDRDDSPPLRGVDGRRYPSAHA